MTTGTRKWLALAALALSGLVVGLDLTVLNLALPTLATSLHASTSGLQWFVDSYSLVFAAVLLPAGLLGDRYGRKRLLLAALVLFGAASVACAYAPSTGALIAARAALGLGAAFIVPLSIAVIPVLFSENERQRAITLVMSMMMIAYPLGPILGGWLLTHFWWGSVFLINVPVIVVAVIAVALLMPESRSDVRPRLDLVGVLVSSAGLTALTYGLIEAGQNGWGDAAALLTMLVGGGVLALFVLWERRLTTSGRRSLVDLSLFRSAGFTWGTVLATFVSFATFGLLFTVPTYFQSIAGADAFGAGLRLLPMIGGLIAGAVIAAKLAPRAGAKVVVAVGFALLAGGLLIGSRTHVHSGFGFAALWVTVMGAGLGFALPAAMDAALGALSPERSGAGSALIMALRQVGGTFGVAILGSIMNAAYHGGLHLTGLPPAATEAVRDGVAAGVAVAHELQSLTLLAMVRHAFVNAMDVMLLVCGLIAVAGIVLSLAFLPRRTTVAAGEREPASAALDGAEAGSAAPARPSPSIAAGGQEGAESAHAAGR